MTPNKRQDEEIKALTKERDDWHRDASSHLKALCEKQAEVNALTLIWTDEKPRKPGWYWRRSHGIERVSKILCVDQYDIITGFSMFNPGGQWAGPIPEPKEA